MIFSKHKKPVPPLPTNPSPPRPGDSIDQWLTMFTRFLRLPREQGRAIRDELDSHLRERVRDLMLEGLSEDEGMRRAIDELGEAAELAAHFQQAYRPNRRMAMNIAVITVAAGAAVMSAIALKQGPAAPPVSQNELLVRSTAPEARNELVAAAPSGVPMLSEVPVIGRLFVTDPSVKLNVQLSEPTLRRLAQAMADQAKLRLSVLPIRGDDLDDKLEPIQLVDVDMATFMHRVNEHAQRLHDNRLDYRVRGDVLEIATVGDFDSVEKKLKVYDLASVYAQNASASDLTDAMTQFIEPDGWHSNGGTTAKLKIVGNRMFVEAPPRYHERIDWMLAQFGARRESRAPQPLRMTESRLADATLREATWARAAAVGNAQAADVLSLHARLEALQAQAANDKARLGTALSEEELKRFGEASVKAANPGSAEHDQVKSRLEQAQAAIRDIEQRLNALDPEGAAPRNAPSPVPMSPK